MGVEAFGRHLIMTIKEIMRRILGIQLHPDGSWMEKIKGCNFMPIAIGLHPVPSSNFKLRLEGVIKSILIKGYSTIPILRFHP